MSRSIHADFVVATALAASMPCVAPAFAQDLQSLCAKLGNDDRVRPIPATLVPQARRLFDISAETPIAFVQKSTSFRCMKGKVWLCNYGANIPCGRANTSRVSQGATAFCRQNPADFVPMAATGHDTIYEWKCMGNKAQISRQTETVDPRGFIAGSWKELK
jgi:hypothetical protein